MTGTPETPTLLDVEGDLWSSEFTDSRIVDAIGRFAPEPLVRAGFRPDDLSLWPATFAAHPPVWYRGSTEEVTDDPSVQYGVLCNRLSDLAGIVPEAPIHDALRWLLVDPDRATNLAEGETLIRGWEDVCEHGWLAHAAGLTPDEYLGLPPEQRTEPVLRSLAALRLGRALPASR